MTIIHGKMTNEEMIGKLQEFNQKNSLPNSRPELSLDQQKSLWTDLERLIMDASRPGCHTVALQTMKILTRNKLLMDSVLSQRTMEVLHERAGLVLSSETKSNIRDDPASAEVILESQRCMSNIYLQSKKSLQFCLDTITIPAIFDQMTKRTLRKPTDLDIASFDMRILFLVTAHSVEARTLALYSYNANENLIKLIRDVAASKEVLGHKEAAVIADAMKVLFNLSCLPCSDQNLDGETLDQMRQMSGLIRELCTMDKETDELSRDIQNNAINLLTNFPPETMNKLADEKSMTVPKMFLDFLIENLQQKKTSRFSSLKESCTPVLKVLCTLSKGHPAVRRYYRHLVLPPLKDVSKRPEDGNAMRNVLCRHLTCADSTVGLMIAEFLFILCKENVKRMVKHTGYGNAAGLLARRGLMCGGKGGDASNYSETDSDSDTDEYIRDVHKVNPVTGCAEPRRPSPFEGMSEEQKEYEAVKLVNLIDRLQSMGVVKPAKVGEDGKPTAVDHVLELAEHHAKKIPDLNESDSDD